MTTPVLMLHGIWKTGAVFARLERYLAPRGFVSRPMNLVPNDGRARLEQLAEDVAREAESAFGAAPFDLLGFSMGGLVARYYLQRLGGLSRVRRFVTLGSPHHGTLTALLSTQPGAAQMRRGSTFLRDLNRDVDRLSAIDVTSIWTPLDMMIVPAESSRLPIGHEVIVATPLHTLLLRDRRSLRAVAEALEAPIGSRQGLRN